MPNRNSLEIASKGFKLSNILKRSFKLFPLYRKNGNQVVVVSKKISETKIMLPISFKKKTYFWVSAYSAFCSISILKLFSSAGKKYFPRVKQAEIVLKNPTKDHLYASFKCSLDEMVMIQNSIHANHQTIVPKTLRPINMDGNTVFCETSKSIYLPMLKTTVSER